MATDRLVDSDGDRALTTLRRRFVEDAEEAETVCSRMACTTLLEQPFAMAYMTLVGIIITNSG